MFCASTQPCHMSPHRPGGWPSSTHPQTQSQHTPPASECRQRKEAQKEIPFQIICIPIHQVGPVCSLRYVLYRVEEKQDTLPSLCRISPYDWVHPNRPGTKRASYHDGALLSPLIKMKRQEALQEGQGNMNVPGKQKDKGPTERGGTRAQVLRRAQECGQMQF